MLNISLIATYPHLMRISHSSSIFLTFQTKEVRLENGKGISGKVAESGKLLNIRNAYEHPSFYKGVDEYTGFRTK